MNMRIHINKKLAEVFFLFLLLLCMYAEAQKDNKFVHQETLENQRRLMNKVETLDPTVEDRGSIATSAPEIIVNETSPTTGKAEKKLSFWSGFVDSLSMIFFVEFGDRVNFCSLLNNIRPL